MLSPTDLDECKANEAACVHPALCDNTYGGYRCICNGTTEVDKTQSCVLGKDPSCRHDHSFITYLRWFLLPSQSAHLKTSPSAFVLFLFVVGCACPVTEREQMSSQELDLILGLVLGIGLPLLLLLLTAIACCCCCRKKTVSGE